MIVQIVPVVVVVLFRKAYRKARLSDMVYTEQLWGKKQRYVSFAGHSGQENAVHGNYKCDCDIVPHIPMLSVVPCQDGFQKEQVHWHI